MTAPRDNPFRVDRVSALPYLDADPNGVARLTDRFGELNQAAIVGPHGVGKSTLLRSLADALSTRGEIAHRLSLPGSATRREQQLVLNRLSSLCSRRVPRFITPKLTAESKALEYPNVAPKAALSTLHAGPAIMLDGYEQLSRWRRHLVRRRCPRLLVTAHIAAGLPTLIELRPTLQTLDAVLGQLLGDPVPPAIAQAAHVAFARNGGNTRDTLFALYDMWPHLA